MRRRVHVSYEEEDTFVICPKRMGSKTFIMVALRWRERRTPDDCASEISFS